jgi:sulfide:quinone oxidoreductase
VVFSDGKSLAYDYLVVATGVTPRPDQVPGLLDERVWHRSAHEFYTLEGALALRDALVSSAAAGCSCTVAEMPVKCPVAPAGDGVSSSTTGSAGWGTASGWTSPT